MADAAGGCASWSAVTWRPEIGQGVSVYILEMTQQPSKPVTLASTPLPEASVLRARLQAPRALTQGHGVQYSHPQPRLATRL